ncbi:MAG: hypothetical protein OEY09_01625 [Gammaproteobacteria bacterium]|nr:hypothetical protein [Gammaproteobacteria bacterium]
MSTPGNNERYPTLSSDSTATDIDSTHIEALDAALHQEWALGRNIILTWVPRETSIDILVIPHYMLSDIFSDLNHDTDTPHDFHSSYAIKDGPEVMIRDVISGPKMSDDDHLQYFSRLFDAEPHTIDIPFTPGLEVPYQTIESMVKRYGISYVEDRAVVLFDIVEFSLLSPLDQVAQLNSLAYSINSAYSKMLDNDIYVNFARTTTGDGFYIWNRDRSIQANVDLYHFMHLILANNAIAHSKSLSSSTPLLRTGFHVGGHYEFYQSEGLSPTVYSYIVGDVTIELSRIVDQALPGQVLLGDFLVPIYDDEDNTRFKLDTIQFIEAAQDRLSSLNGLVLSGDKINSIKCYLTGDKMGDRKEFTVHRYMVVDKHFRGRNVYNAKINIYREDSEPVFLGLQNSELENFKAVFSNFITPTA